MDANNGSLQAVNSARNLAPTRNSRCAEPCREVLQWKHPICIQKLQELARDSIMQNDSSYYHSSNNDFDCMPPGSPYLKGKAKLCWMSLPWYIAFNHLLGSRLMQFLHLIPPRIFLCCTVDPFIMIASTKSSVKLLHLEYCN